MSDTLVGMLAVFQDCVRYIWPDARPTASAAAATATPKHHHGTCIPDSNALLWTCVGLVLSYSLFARILTAVLLRARIAAHRCSATVRHVWLVGFYAATLVCLTVYYAVVLAPVIRRDSGLLFPRYGSALLMPASSATRSSGGFGTMMLGLGGAGGDDKPACSETSQRVGTILVAFHVVDSALLLNGRDFVEAASTMGFALVLYALQANG